MHRVKKRRPGRQLVLSLMMGSAASSKISSDTTVLACGVVLMKTEYLYKMMGHALLFLESTY